MKRQSTRTPTTAPEVAFPTGLNPRLSSMEIFSIKAQQWKATKTVSQFWSIYVPDSAGLVLGTGKGAVKVAAHSIAVVPAGANAARGNSADLTGLSLHFDIGGYAGLELSSRVNKIQELSPTSHSTKIADIKAAFEIGKPIALQLYTQTLLFGALAEIVASSKAARTTRTLPKSAVSQINPALQAVEERLQNVTYQSMKVNEMADMCGMKATLFARTFSDTIGMSPIEYTLKRRTSVAAQRILFTDKTIEEISDELDFANRFYFSRVFKDTVGDSPASYRRNFIGKE